MGRTFVVTALAVAGAGCADPGPPALEIRRITPDHGQFHDPVSVTIDVANIAPRVVVDYAHPAGSLAMEDLVIELGGLPLGGVRLSGAGQIVGSVPQALAPGDQELTVEDASGRRATLADAA